LLAQGADIFESQCIVLAVDVKQKPDNNSGRKSWEAFINDGPNATGLDVIEWIEQAVQAGAGEILITSMDRDGTLSGYDNDLMNVVSQAVNVLIIASGGAGEFSHFADVFRVGADGAIAASLFHDGIINITDLKQYLDEQGFAMRLA
jgi:cyclase